MAAVRLLHQQTGASPIGEVIEVDDNKAVLVITPALVYDMEGEMYILSADTVQAVDDFKVPDSYRREGERNSQLLYQSINV